MKKRDVMGVDLSDLESVAHRYWEYLRRRGHRDRNTRESAEAYEDAWEEVNERTAPADAEALRLLVALAEFAPTDDDPASLGTFQLGELIAEHWRDPIVIDRVCGWAQRSERFATALGYVQYPDDVASTVVERLMKALES